MVKKLITFIFILSVTLFSANLAYSEVCDFSGYEIGSDTKKLKEDFGYTDEDASNSIARQSLPSIEIEFIYICPERGIDNALVHILMFEDEIAGFYLENGAFTDDENHQFILTYLKENYSNDFEFDKPNWDKSRAFWTKNNDIFLYDREKKDSFIKEQLLITRKKYENYIMDMSDKEVGEYVE